jgi:hypothetical protein
MLMACAYRSLAASAGRGYPLLLVTYTIRLRSREQNRES